MVKRQRKALFPDMVLPPSSSVARYLRDARAYCGISQIDAGKLCGVHDSTIRAIERRERDVAYGMVHQIVAVMRAMVRDRHQENENRRRKAERLQAREQRLTAIAKGEL